MSGRIQSETPLSPGSERVIRAAQDAEAGPVPGHVRLLLALWRDESHAADLMRAAGFDPSECGESALCPRKVDVLPAVLREAGRLAASRGDGEIGTQHLLAALLDVDASARDLLPGLDLSRVLDVQAESRQALEPLAFDEQLLGPASDEPPLVSITTHHTPLTNTTDAQRILDAAANRGREGMRVVEDFVRFRLDDAHLSRLLKTLRHGLSDALSRLGGDAWHRLRDTPRDVGTAVRTRQEAVRESLDDVVRANCKRVEESLRSLEEYGKLINSSAAAAIEELRYRFYTIEQAVLNAASSRDRLEACRLYLLLREADCPQGIEQTVREALAGGVDMIQLREKNSDGGRFLELAKQIRAWTHEAGALFIVNDRPDMAVLSDADGVHVGQDDMPCRDARRIVGAEPLVGVSTHSIEQARQAVLDGADYIGVGPVFPSQTKQFDELAGLDLVRKVAVEISLPSFAIGGVDAANIADAMAVGASRVAVSRAVCGAADVRASAEALSAMLRREGK